MNDKLGRRKLSHLRGRKNGAFQRNQTTVKAVTRNNSLDVSALKWLFSVVANETNLLSADEAWSDGRRTPPVLTEQGLRYSNRWSVLFLPFTATYRYCGRGIVKKNLKNKIKYHPLPVSVSTELRTRTPTDICLILPALRPERYAHISNWGGSGQHLPSLVIFKAIRPLLRGSNGATQSTLHT